MSDAEAIAWAERELQAREPEVIKIWGQNYKENDGFRTAVKEVAKGTPVRFVLWDAKQRNHNHS
jgi:hypothetical protein